MQADLGAITGKPLETVEAAAELARQIRQAFAAHAAVESGKPYWQQQFALQPQAAGDPHAKTLLARGTRLRTEGRTNGYLVVFDDISEVISANRLTAWGEVARRLAHEIKNPLTPIQLSAERLGMKLADRLQPQDAAMLQRSVDTIVNQVTSLKHMVDDFREYARTPPAQMQAVDFNALIAEVLSLYGWEHGQTSGELTLDGQPRLVVDCEANLPSIAGDPTQLRQVLHNLLANAKDAATQNQRTEQATIWVRTRLLHLEEDGQTVVRLVIMDNGPGFAPGMLARIFEPYTTTKTTGTGLGLPIVHKIVEEHGARIDVGNRPEGGARVSILFRRLATQQDDRRVKPLK